MGSCEAPPIVPSEQHKVFFELPLPEDGGSPKPFPSTYTEQDGTCLHVKMPNQSYHIHHTTQKIWDVVQEKLGTVPENFETLRKAITSFNQYTEEDSSFVGLESYLEYELSEEERNHFFKSLLPRIISLALSLPQEITQSIPLLCTGTVMSISLSQKQIGVLLANAFLCTFPARPTDGDTCGYKGFPDINFNRLFMRKEVHTNEKFRCIFSYFETITSKDQDCNGVVTFSRVSPKKFNFELCEKPLPSMKLKPEGAIEEADNHLQVDFADKFIGGMIFTKGCVQEEIRFLLCPELIVSRAFTGVLGDNEALIVTGVQKYNKAKGYGRTFKFEGPATDLTPRDEFRRRKCQVVAIDALSFNRRTELQYKPHYISREIHKAYAGFFPEDGTRLPFTPVATGNWGCGVFRGNPYLKSLIQAIAAGAAGRDVCYFAFGNNKLVKELGSLYEVLEQNAVTVGKLTQILCSYSPEKVKPTWKDLYDYIRLKVQV